MSKNIFSCDLKECKLYLEHPILLPCCGSTICKEHENKIEKVGSKYKCPVCRKQHHLLENGFPINKKIFDSMINQNHLGDIGKKVIELFPKLESIIEQYKPTEAELTINDFFVKLRNKIDLHREKMMKEIQKQSEEMLALLKEEEEKHLKNAQDLMKIYFEQIKVEKLPEWKKQIRNPELYEFRDLFDEINEKILEIENDISKYINDSSMKDQITFTPSNLEIDFGKLKINEEFGRLKINLIAKDKFRGNSKYDSDYEGYLNHGLSSSDSDY